MYNGALQRPELSSIKLMAFIAFLNDSAVASALELDGFDSVVD
jgi:hypothetical protein